MKKKSVLAIAIIAIVALVASVSFATWNAITKDQGIVDIDVADRVNIDLEYTAGTIAEGTKLAPEDDENCSVIIPSSDADKVVRSITLGKFTAKFTNEAGDVSVSSHKITVTISGLNANLKYTLTPTTGDTIILKSTDATATVVSGTEYTISVSFIETAGTIADADASAVANTQCGATLTFDAVKSAD